MTEKLRTWQDKALNYIFVGTATIFLTIWYWKHREIRKFWYKQNDLWTLDETSLNLHVLIKKNVVATFISRRIKISLTLSDDCGFNEKHFVKH